jgi:hypothetical protein
LDVFVRSAYPESIALAFAPGMFWATERLISTEKRIYAGLLAIFTAATFVSHPPTLLMFGVPLFFYICFLVFENLNTEIDFKLLLKKLGFLFSGFILGGGLAAFFAIPALLQQTLTKASSLNAGYLDFHSHFACLTQLIWSDWNYGTSVMGCTDQISFQVGIVNWIVIVASIGILAFYLYRKITHPAIKQTLFWLAIAFFGMYMTLSISQPFWEGIPYASFLQFPWRFLSVVMFSAAILSGILFTYLRKETHKIVLFVALIILTPLLSYSFLQPAAYLPKDYFAQDSQDFYKGIAKGQQGGTAEMGYFPKTMGVLPEQNKVPLSKIALSGPNATGKVVRDTFTYKEFDINSKSPIKAELFIHYFPGWTFSINGRPVTPDTSNIYDFVYLSVPAGNNKIVAKFENTPLITAANTISLLSIAILIALLAFELKKIIPTKAGLLKQSKADNLIEEV